MTATQLTREREEERVQEIQDAFSSWLKYNFNGGSTPRESFIQEAFSEGSSETLIELYDLALDSLEQDPDIDVAVSVGILFLSLIHPEMLIRAETRLEWLEA